MHYVSIVMDINRIKMAHCDPFVSLKKAARNNPAAADGMLLS